MTRRFASIVERFGGVVLAVTGLLVLLVLLGLSRLQVENRFIDYFKDTTEIYQGMELLDSRLGGTIPLDIILYPPVESVSEVENSAEVEVASFDAMSADDSFAGGNESFGDDFGEDNFGEDAFGESDFDESLTSDEEDLWGDDPFGEDVSFADENSAEIGYWFTLEGRNLVDQIHDIVDARPESGKVLSLSTGFSVMDRLYDDKLGALNWR